MRRVVLAIVLVVATGLVGCGSDGAEPLTLQERLLTEADVPGSKSDPVEVRLTARNLNEFVGWRGQYVMAADIDRSKLEQAGFVAAIHETRFIPNTPGGSHTRDAAHVRLLVMQFESEDGAATGIALMHESDLKPCPGTCAVSISEFDVSGVPDANGVRHFATAESIKATEDPGEPFDSYTIMFANGSFVYQLEGFGPPGKALSKKQVEQLAEKLHDRVDGAPPAST